ncbi:shikimate kinase AroL [Maridesulfovibrio hydrothermalis]|uniref:Shikimate kinase n=1 Tax=Maridesulfovibrio hydrothermalis AM13 = DSM 14728 TaxID=1121451 RepID=L0R7D4_9BACT|nr:shikimate kinase AroL [Maridesulfovibrio hydrothermalis]CCO22127.1 Shikimate kinase [Maridesulfovibrio hydrothermalis AM13 = DSM 14728]
MSRVYLIGPRACGKTTVGRILAEKLKFKFYDSDSLIVERAGCEIAAYVESHGWSGFRDLESAVLNGLSGKSEAVISCGGGIVVREENLFILRRNYTVYLKTDVQVLADRLSVEPEHGQRPSLTGKPLVEEIQQVLDEREDLYSGCATYIVDGAAAVDEICNQILNSYKSFEQGDI